jgi:uncharacterized DUF497 family protein
VERLTHRPRESEWAMHRFNAIGFVDGRMLFVTYTMRGDVVRIISTEDGAA